MAQRVGILGGSFNPAHDGHLYISQCALKSLGLDQVWWLVTPQNPLKPTDGMAPFEERYIKAQQFVTDPRIIVSDFEARVGTQFTVDALELLLKDNIQTRFVWLMGADNLLEAHRWSRWTSIFNTVPIAVLARPHLFFKGVGFDSRTPFCRGSRGGKSGENISGYETASLGLFKYPAS